MFYRWALGTELATFIAISMVGGTFGTAVTYPIGGLLLHKFDWEVRQTWKRSFLPVVRLICVTYFFQSLFYFSGFCGMFWLIIWTIFASNDPLQNRFVSSNETELILQNRHDLGEENKRTMPPFCKILSIPTILICALGEFGYSVASYLVIIEGPTFIKEILGKDIASVSGLLRQLYKCSRQTGLQNSALRPFGCPSLLVKNSLFMSSVDQFFLAF